MEDTRVGRRGSGGWWRGRWFRVVVTLALVSVTGVGALAGQADVDCLKCHANAEFFRARADSARLVVPATDHGGSVHGVLGLQCVNCHQGITGYPHPPATDPIDCGACHATITDAFNNSLHGYALARGYPRAPTCAGCHGVHDIQSSSDPASPTHKSRVAELCASCHGSEGLLTDHLVRLPRAAVDYARSVHGQSAARGVTAAASCADCHRVHDPRHPSDPASTINPLRVSATCGQCHADVQREYDRSIHGLALQAGVHDSPTCTDCHGEHLILSPRDPGARTYAARLATQTCGSCHDDPAIISKFSLAGGVVGSYVDSYHGWATRRNYERSATCVSCHTAHAVLPAADSTSAIHATNVVATCQKCHPRADRRFAASYSHEAASITTNPVNRIIRNIYVVLIAVLIGGMVLHNLLIMNYYVIERRRSERRGDTVLRLDRTQVIQHLALTVSFIVLVITGFALRFPEAWWVVGLSELGMTEPVRSTVHRVSAVLLVLVGVHHVLYVVLARRGRQEIRAMVPQLQDAKDAVTNLRYHTWRTKSPAKFGRYDYTQKAEYWALVWGTIVMALTGFVLWFPEQAVKVLPSIVVTASQTIHYYEAWLATLAILVWHFFFVIFHPHEYPMSWTWLTGQMSTHTARELHGQWYAEELAQQEKGTGGSTAVPGA